ncbi:MAG TPA: NtaA/DmoA family FMN-dependent monooxygenase [Pseudolysinimonas sp.]|nr:NtaA/DmoA family FMN-dependent monooxygenase [Pseudolysinimonas sp.]
MSHLPLRLGIFHTFGPMAWHADEDRLHGGDWWTGDAHIELARRLEEATFDFLFFEDTATVSRSVGGTMDADLKSLSYAPKHDALVLLAALAKATSNIGLFATASTTFYPPWLLARTLSTLDSMSNGRIGWNIVTTADPDAADNFGLTLPDHDQRYAMAEEYLDVVKALWDAWDADALVRDQANNIHVDPSKVHAIDHDGTYYSVRGPLNTLRSPQGTPILIQAGTSPAGRDFAARHAELVFAPMEGGVEGMIAFREDIRKRAAEYGRAPDDVKIVWATFVNFDQSQRDFDATLTFWSSTLAHDLSQYPLDEPFPAELTPSGHTGFFEELQSLGARGISLRDALIEMENRGGEGELDLSGEPETVAERLIALNDQVGGDGYLIVGSFRSNPAFLTKVIDRMVPVLKAAGVMQTEYASGTTREKLATPVV